MNVERLEDARLVYVTPSHQFPTGMRMTLARRRQLLAWAEANDALVIEDDYDGEFRFDGPPLPPLASLHALSLSPTELGDGSAALSLEQKLGLL